MPYVRVSLEQWEWDMLDAEADACGMTRQELMHEMFLEGIAFELSDSADVVMPIVH